MMMLGNSADTMKPSLDKHAVNNFRHLVRGTAKGSLKNCQSNPMEALIKGLDGGDYNGEATERHRCQSWSCILIPRRPGC